MDADDLTPAEGPLDFSNKTFLGNNAKEAKSAYILGFENTSINFDNGTFDVYGYNSKIVSKYWIISFGDEIRTWKVFLV